jgi:hypothetical protein
MEKNMTLETHTNDPDYIERRDELLKFIRKQNLLWEMGFRDENAPGKPRGRKPSPSKRIVNVDYSKKRNHYSWFD